jgi:hypothetical protein
MASPAGLLVVVSGGCSARTADERSPTKTAIEQEINRIEYSTRKKATLRPFDHRANGKDDFYRGAFAASHAVDASQQERSTRHGCCYWSETPRFRATSARPSATKVSRSDLLEEQRGASMRISKCWIYAVLGQRYVAGASKAI